MSVEYNIKGRKWTETNLTPGITRKLRPLYTRKDERCVAKGKRKLTNEIQSKIVVRYVVD